jgi:outer membrane receptor protein involved in Fe transport
MSFDYRRSTGIGDFTVQLVGGYLDRIEFVSTPGAEVDNDLGEGPTGDSGAFFPKFTSTLDVSWTRGPLTLAYGLNWASKTDRFTRETLRGDPDYADSRFFRVKEKWDHDIHGSFDITDQVNVFAGVNNVLDQKPAFGYSSYPISAMGRYFYAGAKMNLGGS